MRVVRRVWGLEATQLVRSCMPIGHDWHVDCESSRGGMYTNLPEAVQDAFTHFAACSCSSCKVAVKTLEVLPRWAIVLCRLCFGVRQQPCLYLWSFTWRCQTERP